MTHRYEDAIGRYVASRLAHARSGQTPPNGRSPEDIEKAAAELDQFLKSEEGQMSLALLAASGMLINLGVLMHGPKQTRYYLDGQGLHQQDLGDLSAAHPEECSAEEAVVAYTEDSTQRTDSSRLVKYRNAHHILPWLRAVLDFIAAVAPTANPS